MLKSSFLRKSSNLDIDMQNDKEARDRAAASKKMKKPVVTTQDVTNTKPEAKQQSRKSKDTANKPKNSSKFASISHKGNNWELYLREAADGVNPVLKRPTMKYTDKNDHRRISGPSGDKTSESSGPKMTRVLGMDCEMVGVGEDGKDSILARVSIVNGFGDCIYDKYVKPREKVTDYRTYVSGIREDDIINGEDFDVVQKEVAEILRKKILVGHAIKNDLEVLFLSHPRSHIRDTAKFFRKGGSRTPSLKTLASQYLDVQIQEGEHSSVQDAKAAVQLYNLYRKQWEIGGGNRKHNRIDTYHHKIKNSRILAEDT